MILFRNVMLFIVLLENNAAPSAPAVLHPVIHWWKLEKCDSSQQAIHDEMERKMSKELSNAKEVIEQEWTPNKQMRKDYDRAKQCYTAFHLYKVKGCDAQLDKLEQNIEAIPPIRDR